MSQPLVDTKSGRLRGSVQKNIDGNSFLAFKGIPYAEPPVGDLRFQDPKPVKPWQGTRDALDFGPVAAQFDFLAKFMGGSDDCLYLNVYTKSIEANVRRPVMVWIHGGGFVCGSGNDVFFGPDYFMKKDIVLVTINYRLGVLGFLNLQDELAPGNYGLKDQVMALQWVRENIANFSGDPGNVTIFGESAGGASVHYLTLSPLAKGLFHRAISQSGVAICPWGSAYGEPKQFAYELCSVLGKKTTDHKEIVKFLRTVDPLKLVEAQGQMAMPSTKKQLLTQFIPGVDNKSSNSFMPVPVEVAAKEGAHVPYLIGYNKHEGTLLFELFRSEDYEERNANFEDYIHPNTIKLLQTINATSKDLRHLYFQNEKITKDNYEKFNDLLSDMMFVLPIHKVVKIQVEHNSAPTYMYHFTYDNLAISKSMNKNSAAPSPSHMDEVLYLFKMQFSESIGVEPIQKNSKNYRIMEQMLELWTNFAKTGQPTPRTSELVPLYWQPVIDGTVLRHMNIGEDLQMEKTLNLEERFYNSRVSSNINI